MKNCSPGNAHTNVIWQRYDGTSRYGELDIRAGILVFSVNVTDYDGNYYKREEVWDEGQRWQQVFIWCTLTDAHTTHQMVKDTDSKYIDPINSILVVVPVCSMVAAQQRSGLIALMLR